MRPFPRFSNKLGACKYIPSIAHLVASYIAEFMQRLEDNKLDGSLSLMHKKQAENRSVQAFSLY